MSEAHASFLIDLETKKYSDGLTRIQDQTKATMTRMVGDMDATAKATDRLTTGANTATKGMYRLGQTSMQLQDVVVQLQGGTKFATVLAQQGSQMASIFGPGGALLGGAIAIGAAIWTWASGASAAEKEMKAVEKQAKATLAAVEKMEGSADRDNQAAASAAGKEIGARERYEQSLAEIAEEEGKIDRPAPKGLGAALAYAKGEYEKMKERQAAAPVNARAAAEKRLNAELAKEQREADEKRFAAQDRMTEKIQAEKAKLHDNSTSDEANMMELAKSIGEREQLLAGRTLTPEKWDQEYLTQLKEQNELIAEGKRLHQDGIQTAKEGAEEDKKWRAEFDKTVEQADKVEKLQKQRLEIEKDITKEIQKQNVQRSVMAGEATLQGAAQHLMTPQQRAAARQQSRREDRAVQREISEELDNRDRWSRRHGGRGLSPEERNAIREEREQDVRRAGNKEKILAAIEDDSITKLTDKLQEVLDKLLAK